MYFLKGRNDIVSKSKFDDKIYKSTGELLVKDTDFEVLAVNTLNGSSIGNVITLSLGSLTENPFKEGENVIITEPDGLFRGNVIVNVGTNKITLKRAVLGQGAVTVKNADVNIQLIDLEEGVYTFSDHSGMIVSDTFINVFIPQSILLTRYMGKLSGYNNDFTNLNETAVLSVLAEYSYDLTFFQTIDLGQVTELVLRKIGQILENPEDNFKYTNEYKEYKKVVDNKAKSDNGVSNHGTTNDTNNISISTSGITWSWGAR